jgi:hypothetical protein
MQPDESLRVERKTLALYVCPQIRSSMDSKRHECGNSFLSLVYCSEHLCTSVRQRVVITYLFEQEEV